MLEWIFAFGIAALLIFAGILLSVICIALAPWSLAGMTLLIILTIIVKKHMDKYEQ